MSKKLLGSGSGKKSNSPKGMGGRALTQSDLSPSKRGTPEEVAARDYEAVKGKKRHDQLKKNKSASSPL